MSDNLEPIQEVAGVVMTVALLKSLLTAIISGLGYYGFIKLIRNPKSKESFIKSLLKKFEKLKRDPEFQKEWTKKYGELKKEHQQDHPNQRFQKSDKEAFKDWIRNDWPDFAEDAINLMRS